MSTNDPRYAAVNELHALGYPAITRAEAGVAARLLVMRFGNREDACAVRTLPMIRIGLLHKWTRGHTSGARRCWASTKPTTGFHTGWGRLIHDLGHMVYAYRHLLAGHGPGEEAIELEVAQYVRASGWLDGTLKPKREPRHDARTRRSLELNALSERIRKWEGKRKRAETALKKLNKRRRALERAQNPPLVGVVGWDGELHTN